MGLLGAAAITLAASTVTAQVVPVPYTPQVNSSNPATAEPPVLPARDTTPNCIVTLFDNHPFVDYTTLPLTYTPPAGCGSGRWSKVVLTIDFTVTAGRQFDRTASLYLGNANIFYGTTAEPRSTLSPSWNIQRDVTDLSALFKTAQSGQAVIYNIVDDTYTGKIYATAKLHFFPADLQHPPAIVPDVVIPVSGSNSPVELDTTTSAITTTVTAPRNTVKAYLDVISQSQHYDEFWYLGAPADVAGELETLPDTNTAFRETEITIDGVPAGVAPVYPWIYTGGIDPYLWEPITGVQTLNFKPYRVDLTPFAGLLSDGKPHIVGISVYNASNYFLATANLLLYTDPFRQQTGGGVLENTLTAPSPQVVENLQADSTGNVVTGTVNVGSKRSFVIKGYVNTALGRVETTVEQTVGFNSLQTYNINNNTGLYVENVQQTSTVDGTTTSQLGFLREQTARHTSFPLTLSYNYTTNADGSSAQVVTSDQKNVEATTRSINGFPLTQSSSAEQVHTNDTLTFPTTGGYTAGPTASSASYQSQDNLGNCYSRQLTSSNRVLTSVTDGKGCPTNR